MDILDILLGRALSPNTQADVAAKEAKAAAAEAKEIADSLEDIPNISVTYSNTSTQVSTTADISTNNGTNQILYKNYKQSGDNEDGSMTQKAITAYVNSIAEGSGTGGSTNLGEENSGNIVVVGENGNIQSGSITEESIIQTQLIAGTYTAEGTYGIKIDYENKIFIFDQENFISSNYFMRRCLVNNDGEIICFQNDLNYEDDKSKNNYQTMVVISKFYYLRMPLRVGNDGSLKEEELIISLTKKPGFKLHPAFINDAGEEVEYFLFSAYEGSGYNSSNGYNTNDSIINFNTDMLSSVAGVKPASGARQQFTIENAEKIAKKRGLGWHITSIKAISALQMLGLIGCGSADLQTALGQGVTAITNVGSSVNGSSLTGSTSNLVGDGIAEETINENNGTYTTYTDENKCAVSFWGIENLWGNIWTMVGGIKIIGYRTSNNSVRSYYAVCDSLDYTGRYIYLNYEPPTESDWIGSLGYDKNFDWVMLPASVGGNNKLPIGDYIWVGPRIGTNKVLYGGSWGHQDYAGLFTVALDTEYDATGRSTNARLMFVPPINQVYNTNINEINSLKELNDLPPIIAT